MFEDIGQLKKCEKEHKLERASRPAPRETLLTPTPSLLEIAYAVAVYRCGTFLVLTRSLFFIFLELNLSLQVCSEIPCGSPSGLRLAVGC